MLYDGNFRFDETEDKLIALDFGIPELIDKNIKGELDNGHSLMTIILRHTKKLEKKSLSSRFVLMAKPFGGETFYTLTPIEAHHTSGGFIYENGILYFASNMMNLNDDRDAYRQEPDIIKGNYYTDSSFDEIINEFKIKKIPLIKTTDERVSYDKSYWPNESISNFGEISYEEALKQIKY